MRPRLKQYPGRPLLEHLLDWLVTAIIITLPVAMLSIAYLLGQIAGITHMVAAR